jgi:GDP-4-dehydro-6-deoxy-D-mannose reductase
MRALNEKPRGAENRLFSLIKLRLAPVGEDRRRRQTPPVVGVAQTVVAAATTARIVRRAESLERGISQPPAPIPHGNNRPFGTPGVPLKRLLVTGIHGFVGSTLARMVASEASLSDWTILPISPELDLGDRRAADELVEATRPDAVIHLAALSSVAESFKHPEATLNVNLIGTLHLLQALKAAGFSGRMVYVGTGDIYGMVDEADLPVVETRAPAPRNPYAVSKFAAETLCRQWVFTEGMSIVMARPFNHIGPGQSTLFAIPDFARQIVEIRLGRHAPTLAVGDIDVTRDFTDVRDVVRAYFELLRAGVAGEVYNVCSGIERSVRSLLERLIAIAGMEVRIETDPARMRKSEQRRMCGSAARIQGATGWVPALPLDESLQQILQYWEGELTHG